MRFILIKPVDTKVDIIEAANFDEAKARAGLDGVDFGTLGRDLSICIHEAGLLQELGQGYFSVGRRLYAGEAVIFAFDDQGDTVDIEPNDVFEIQNNIRFYANAEEAEQAIGKGRIDRPQNAVNGKVLWRWNIDGPRSLGEIANGVIAELEKNLKP